MRQRRRRLLECVHELEHPFRLDLGIRIEEEDVRSLAPLPADVAATAEADVLVERNKINRKVRDAGDARVTSTRCRRRRR